MEFARFVAVSSFAAALAACGSAQPGGSKLTTSLGVPEISNFHEVNTDLFRSGHIDGDQFGALRQDGVKTVLSLEDFPLDPDDAQEEATAAGDHGLGDIWQPMSGFEKPTVEQVNAALRTINNPSLQPILVHCRHGSDRTGIVVAAYRMTHDGWTEDQAIEEMRSLGHSRLLYWWDDVLDAFR